MLQALTNFLLILPAASSDSTVSSTDRISLTGSSEWRHPLMEKKRFPSLLVHVSIQTSLNEWTEQRAWSDLPICYKAGKPQCAWRKTGSPRSWRSQNVALFDYFLLVLTGFLSGKKEKLPTVQKEEKHASSMVPFRLNARETSNGGIFLKYFLIYIV